MAATAREARARRRVLIRRRVVAATLSAFVLAWGVIAFYGSMGAQATATATATASSSAATGSTGDRSSSADLPAVTTAQS